MDFNMDLKLGGLPTQKPDLSALKQAKVAPEAATPETVKVAQQQQQQSAAETAATNLEQVRFEAVQKAASTVANYYPVSDSTFTIFKDGSGQYITRFTNLKDGSVSYFPEPQLLKKYQSLTGSNISILSTKA